MEPGSSEEALEEAAAVLHPFEPGLTRVMSWQMSRLAGLACDRFRTDHTLSTGFSSDAYSESRNTVSQSQASVRPVIDQASV